MTATKLGVVTSVKNSLESYKPQQKFYKMF